jgi:Spy/CpxP family protein refolding chaperone
MKVKFLYPLVTVLFSMMVMAGTAYAQDDGSIMDRLGLNAQQKEQVKDLREKFRSETEKLRSDIKRLLEEERELKSADQVKESALAAKLRQRADKEIELTLALTRFNERLESILTSDQKRVLEKIRAEKRSKR